MVQLHGKDANVNRTQGQDFATIHNGKGFINQSKDFLLKERMAISVQTFP